VLSISPCAALVATLTVPCLFLHSIHCEG
jgi:hypothetical protein